MNKNSPLNQRYICPIGADGIHFLGLSVRSQDLFSKWPKGKEIIS